MKITNLKVRTPNGQKFKVCGEVEHTPKNGYQLVKITSVNSQKVEDNFILKELVSSEDILNHLKNNL